MCSLTKTYPSKYFKFHLPVRFISGINQWNNDLSITIKKEIESYWSPKVHPAYQEKSLEKYYVLPMFPYPSGNLHMGHVRVYTISDSIARLQRMNDKDVIHPIGWDAFGLPAENAALERQIPPNKWTRDNIKYMKNQLQRLGCSFDWNREISTCDPEYYKWTQLLFLKLFKAGLAYQSKSLVNWDPIDKTVLADEQVDENNKSWRSGAVVEKKVLKQWFIRTTQFARQLYEGLNDSNLEDWQDIIKIQKHWIGECDGVCFYFNVVVNGVLEKDNVLAVWTRIPEYLNHVKFVVISKDNLLGKIYSYEYVSGTFRLSVKLINPLNGSELDVFISDSPDFISQNYCHLGIPSVFETDRTFADKFGIKYDRSVTKFTRQEDIKEQQAIICARAKELGIGGFWTSEKLRDWLISRQRHWGTPIPIIHCEKCGAQPVPETMLPVILPGVKDKENFPSCSCPKCGEEAHRETDTMDTFVDSSWYYLRYLDPHNDKDMFSVSKVNQFMPVDLYIGGKEHATLHLYYARFINHFLHSQHLTKYREPFKRLLVQGMVMGRTYRIKGTGRYIPSDQVTITDPKKKKAIHSVSGEPVVTTWEKMSKSKYNGVDPNDMFQEYGVDTTRLLILADIAPTSHRKWNSDTFPGILNWQRRLWLTIGNFLDLRRNPRQKTLTDVEFNKLEDYMFDSRNFYLKGATFNYLVSQQMSVAISKMQGLTNSLRKMPKDVVAHSTQYERALACQIILLAPMAPHFASELWSGFVSAPNRLTQEHILWDKGVLEQPWPHVDQSYHLDLVFQINGVESSMVKMPRNKLEKLSEGTALELALNEPKIKAVLNQWPMQSSTYKVFKGYEAVLNINTNPSKKI